MSILKRFTKVLDREVRITIKEAKNLAIPYSKEPSKPTVIYHNGKNDVLVEPSSSDSGGSSSRAAPASSAARSIPTNIRFNHEGTLNPGFDLRLNIVVKDHGLIIGHCKLGLQKLHRGLRVSSWYPLKPEGQGELLIELVAVNFGKIAKPIRKIQNPAVQLSNDQYLQTKAPISAPVESPKKEIIKEYKKNQIRRMLPHIAAGHFGIIYKGTVSNRKEIIAIKDIKVTDYTLFEEWKKEVEFMSQHKNTFIVQVYGFCCNSKILTIVMEYMENGSLFDLLHGEEVKLEFNHFDRLRMARQVALGVAFLHVNKILHRDIKSLNILVSKNRICKIADFGSAKLISLEQLEYYTADVGTPLWMAPEVRFGKAYNLSADIYSLGVVLYEIFENKLPDYDKEQTMIVIHSFNFPSGPLISPMLNLNPNQRPSGEFIAKQLNKILQYVVEKGRHAIDFDALMSPQSVHSKEAIKASNLVNEGLTVYSKEFLPLSLSGAYDDEDDLVIVNNNNEEYDLEDDDEDEFQDIDYLNDMNGDRPLPLSGASQPKLNNSKPISNSSLKQYQQIAKLESQIQYLEEEMMRSRTVHDITNDSLSPKFLQPKSDLSLSKSLSAGSINGLKHTPQMPIRTRQGLVLYSFEPENPGELAVQADDVIEVISVKGEWVECLTSDRRHGWIPFNYVHVQDYQV